MTLDWIKDACEPSSRTDGVATLSLKPKNGIPFALHGKN